MKKGRTPLKNPPLHNPGESLQNELDTLMSDKALIYIAILSLAPGMALWEWLRYWTHQTPHPIVVTLTAIPFMAFSLWKLKSLLPRLRNISHGIQAEKSVGQYLEQFRVEGYQIFHDIPGESGGKKFNLDHIIIGPKGIFTIETKYAHKRHGQAKVRYLGEEISIDGYKPERNPVIQAKAQAHWLHDRLLKGTGQKFFVQPVVVYPGWWVENKQGGSAVWVINEKALPSFVENSARTLSDLDIHTASDHLSRYIQSTLK